MPRGIYKRSKKRTYKKGPVSIKNGPVINIHELIVQTVKETVLSLFK